MSEHQPEAPTLGQQLTEAADKFREDLLYTAPEFYGERWGQFRERLRDIASDHAAPCAEPDDWEPARYSLDGYAREHLIESWREVPGRGLIVIGADMAETELRTARDAEMFLAGLASAECAVHDGEAEA